jgi:hypothetical protein
VGGVAVVVFHVEQEHGMGIGPHEFRYRGLLHDHYFVGFVRRASVVGIQGAANRGKATEQSQKQEQLALQVFSCKYSAFGG